MYIIKNNSLINAYIFRGDDCIDGYDFLSENDLEFETTHFCGDYACDCCGGVTIRLIDMEYSQKIGLAVIYETQIQNIVGFENCTTKEESDELIYRKVCDLHGIAYDRRTVECAYVSRLRHSDNHARSESRRILRLSLI